MRETKNRKAVIRFWVGKHILSICQQILVCGHDDALLLFSCKPHLTVSPENRTMPLIYKCKCNLCLPFRQWFYSCHVIPPGWLLTVFKGTENRIGNGKTSQLFSNN